MDKEDLCAAKLCAFREKAGNFVAALLAAGLADADVIMIRLQHVPQRMCPSAERTVEWLATL